MKFQTQEYHTNQSSNVAGQAFQVSLTAKFFETLFSGLYRYKEAAVMRELFCNAIDAHKMRDNLYCYMPQPYASVYAIQRHVVSEHLAEQNTKVEIHLPDVLEPWLEIKDYGIGLSLEKILGEAIPAHEGEVLIEGNVIVQEDEIPEGKGVIGEPGWYKGTMVFRSPDNNEILRSAGLYTTLFDSTKADSNDQIGAFGLGSKSPFAVSDSFTVESRYNGELHNYIMFLNDKRIPSVELATKDLDTRDPEPLPTLEPNGLTVRVPVRSVSYEAFASQLSDLCRVLLPEEYPVVTNDDYFQGFTPISREHKIYDTYVQKAERKSHASTHYAVMGGVAYPIELDQLDQESAALLERFPSTYTFFPLGALNVPPSREDLSYDQFTKAALTGKMTELRKGILDEAMEDIRVSAAKGPLWLVMAKQRYSEMYGNGFKKLMDVHFPPDPRFKDGHITQPYFNTDLDYDSESVKNAGYNYMLGGSGVKTLFHITRYNSVSSRDDDAKFSVNYVASAARENTRPVVIIFDNLRSYAQKIKQFLHNNSRVDCIWAVTPNPNLLTWRDLELEKQYLNHKEIKETITKWIGTGKTPDYLQFADEFTEYYDGIINPVVKFMSELPYEPLKITGDIGMLKYSNYRGTGRYGNGGKKIEGTPFHSENIMKVAESGKKIIYVEFSGHDMVHEGMTHRKAYEFQTVLQYLRMKSEDSFGDDTLQFMHDRMGWYSHICIVRKKAIPFLKQNADYFVDINDAVKELNELLKPIMHGMEYGRFSESGSKLRYAAGNIAYHQWIMEQLGAQKGDDTDLNKMYTQSFDIQQRMRESAVFAKECQDKFNAAVEEYGRDAYDKSESYLQECRSLMAATFSYKDMSDEFDKARRAYPDFERLERKLADILNCGVHYFGHTKNRAVYPSRGRNERVGHMPSHKKFNESVSSRKAIRRAIEAYKLIEFINSNYKATMGGKLCGADELLESVVNKFKENLRF